MVGEVTEGVSSTLCVVHGSLDETSSKLLMEAAVMSEDNELLVFTAMPESLVTVVSSKMMCNSFKMEAFSGSFHWANKYRLHCLQKHTTVFRS